MPTTSCDTRWRCAIPLIIIVTFTRCFHSSAHNMVFIYNERRTLKTQVLTGKGLMRNVPGITNFEDLSYFSRTSYWKICAIMHFKQTFHLKHPSYIFHVIFHARDLVLGISNVISNVRLFLWPDSLFKDFQDLDFWFQIQFNFQQTLTVICMYVCARGC